MANIKWGMMIVDGRGKLGGHVLTKSRSGATVRTKVTPSNPQSSYQGYVRSIFGQVSSAWAGLAETSRSSWNQAVANFSKTNAFGDIYLPSGKNLFTSLNSLALQCNSTLQETAPAVVPIIPIVADSATITLPVEGDPLSEGAISIVLQNYLPDPAFLTFVEATPPMSAGRYNFKGSYRRIGIYSVNISANAAVLYDDYVAKYGTPAPGTKISLRVRAVHAETGQAGVWSSVDAIVEAR